MKTSKYDDVKTVLFIIITFSILALTAYICGVELSMNPLPTILVMAIVLLCILILTPDKYVRKIAKVEDLSKQE